MRTRCLCSITLAAAYLSITSATLAQVGANASQPTATPPAPLPVTTQIKKAVVFIQTDCLHIPNAEELAKLSPHERSRWTPEAVAKLTPEELARLKHDPHSGTGFIVYVPDERLGKNVGFNYLVTNRHVAQPGIEDGKPCKVVKYSLFLNHRGASDAEAPHLQMVPFDNMAGLVFFPDDPSVDLATLPIRIEPSLWDYESVPISMFISQGMVDQHLVVEGDPVLFSGLFVQYESASRLEPIVRSGSIAMLPTELIPTTLRKPGHIYLAEAHAFKGNSGSPMFVDINKFTNRFGPDYRFLGVVSGEVTESSDLTLQVSTTYEGKVSQNSDISVVVPAEEVKKLLLSPKLQAMRDNTVASFLQHNK